MKVLRISYHQSWGISKILLPLEQIKCIEYEDAPGYLSIWYLNRKIIGIVSDGNFCPIEFFDSLERNESCSIRLLKDENLLGQDEE